MQTPEHTQDDLTVASRYLDGTLSDAERSAYERHFLDNPDAVNELEATARMKVGLANLRETRRLEPLLKAPTVGRRTAGWAIAASVVVLVAAVTLWRQAGLLGDTIIASAPTFRDGSGSSLSVGSSYALVPVRSSMDYDAFVELPPAPQAIELRVQPDIQASLYRATLSRIQSDGSVVRIAALGDLRMEADRFVRLYVDSSRLEPGPYLLVLSAPPDNAGESATSSFRLKVLRPRGGS